MDRVLSYPLTVDLMGGGGVGKIKVTISIHTSHYMKCSLYLSLHMTCRDLTLPGTYLTKNVCIKILSWNEQLKYAAMHLRYTYIHILGR